MISLQNLDSTHLMAFIIGVMTLSNVISAIIARRRGKRIKTLEIKLEVKVGGLEKQVEMLQNEKKIEFHAAEKILAYREGLQEQLLNQGL